MSECPFANDTLKKLLPLIRAMEPKLQLRVEFLGKNEHGVLSSFYGEQDLMGGKLHVCATAKAGRAAASSFLACAVRAPSAFPENYRECAHEAAIDVQALSDCAMGEEGQRLLGSSFTRARDHGVLESPTLFIAGRRYDLAQTQVQMARVLCKALSASAPSYCSTVPAPVSVDITVLTADKRCVSEACSTDAFTRFVGRSLPKANIKRVEGTRPEASILANGVGVDRAPFAILSSAIEREPEVFAQLVRAGLSKVNGQTYLFPLAPPDAHAATHVPAQANTISSAPR